MKRLFALSMAVMLFASVAKAQNSSYADDRYYSGSDAEQDANATAQQQKSNAAVQQYDASSAYYDNSNNGNVSDDGYIDYDDDSYTTRINRFYYPMGMSYWGSVYSPYYNDPFWYNPYYSWGGYYPGFSVSFGFGGPYWSSCWAYNAWYGYGGFYPYYGWGGYPYYGGGYGLGYWNGFYDGFYANNYYHNNYYGLGNTVYGARGNRSMVGNYTRSRLAQINTNNRIVTPLRGRSSNNGLSINNGNMRNQGGNAGKLVRGQSFQGNNAGNERIVLKGNAQRVQNNGSINNSNQRVFRQEPQATNNTNRRGGFLGGVFSGNRSNTYSPGNSGRSYEVQRTQPARSYERSEPSRSYSQPSRSSSSFEGSRSSSSFGGGRSSGGGGSRSFGRGR